MPLFPYNHLLTNTTMIQSPIIGQGYFYCNHPVVILSKKTEDIYEVAMKMSAAHELRGEQWCMACQIGSTASTGYISHTHEPYDEVIEELDDALAENTVTLVDKKYLHAEPFEKVAFEAGVKKVREVEKVIAEKQASVTHLETERQKMANSYAEYMNLLLEAEKKKADLLAEIEEIRESEVAIPKEILVGTKRVSIEEFKSLVEDALSYRALQAAGVDNWDGDYDLPEEGDVLEYLVNL